MFVVANFLHALATLLDTVLYLYMLVIVIRALISWVNPDPYNPIVQFLVAVTEPVLSPVRRWIPAYMIGIDISPIIVILAIMFLKSFLVLTLHQLADHLQ
jgi:YggT family protein